MGWIRRELAVRRCADFAPAPETPIPINPAAIQQTRITSTQSATARALGSEHMVESAVQLRNGPPRPLVSLRPPTSSAKKAAPKVTGVKSTVNIAVAATPQAKRCEEGLSARSGEGSGESSGRSGERSERSGEGSGEGSGERYGDSAMSGILHGKNGRPTLTSPRRMNADVVRMRSGYPPANGGRTSTRSRMVRASSRLTTPSTKNDPDRITRSIDSPYLAASVARSSPTVRG